MFSRDICVGSALRLFVSPNADYVLVRRVVGCAIVILVPMSVAHHMMLGFTLLPRTFAEYACCRFVEIR